MKKVLFSILIILSFIRVYALSDNCSDELINNGFKIDKITETYIYATREEAKKIFHKILCIPLSDFDEFYDVNSCSDKIKKEGYTIKKDYTTYLEVEKDGKNSVFDARYCFEYKHLKNYDSYKIIDKTDYILVSKNNKYGILTGWNEIPVEFDRIKKVADSGMYSDYFIVKKDDKYGLYYYDDEILKPEYDKIKPTDWNEFICQKDKKKNICRVNKEYVYYDEILSAPIFSYKESEKIPKSLPSFHMPSLDCILMFWFWPANIVFCQSP